jgi:hypothetical protein
MDGWMDGWCTYTTPQRIGATNITLQAIQNGKQCLYQTQGMTHLPVAVQDEHTLDDLDHFQRDVQ